MGLTIEQVAERLPCSPSKISRLETGQTVASPRDVRDMLGVYQVPERELEILVEVAREARQKGWWQPYDAVLTGAYVGFEAAAASIRTYEAQCVPGLLQTEDYARSVFLAGTPDMADAELEGRVEVRMARQALLTQEEDTLRLWVIIDEAVLHRPVGGRAAMRRQLSHISHISRLPNVIMQVLPYRAGAHAGLEGSFAILHFPDPADADMVYVAMATGGVFQEKADELRRYSTVFEFLQAAALAPDDSAAMVANLAREHT